MTQVTLKRAGQGLSVNMIILVAIGLIILVIAVLLVNKSGKNLSENTTKSCISLGGTCQATCSGNFIEKSDGAASCNPEGWSAKPYCCIYNYAGEPTQ